MHLVGARLEPGEEALCAVPDLARPGALALDHPAPRLGAELAPRGIERNTAELGELLQVLLALGVGLRLPGLDCAAAQRARLIRDHEPVVDPDGTAEAAAALARAEWGVEGERARGRQRVGQVAVGAMQLARIPPALEQPRRIAVIDHVHVDASAADPQRSLERLDDPGALSAAGAEAILYHLENGHSGRRAPPP